MGKYSRDEFSDALQVVSSTISKCEKIQKPTTVISLTVIGSAP